MHLNANIRIKFDEYHFASCFGLVPRHLWHFRDWVLSYFCLENLILIEDFACVCRMKSPCSLVDTNVLNSERGVRFILHIAMFATVFPVNHFNRQVLSNDWILGFFGHIQSQQSKSQVYRWATRRHASVIWEV